MFPKGLYIKGLYIGLYIMCVVMGNRAALMGLYKTYKGLYVIKYKEFFLCGFVCVYPGVQNYK